MKNIICLIFVFLFVFGYSQKEKNTIDITPAIVDVYWAIGNKKNKVSKIEEYQEGVVILFVETKNIPEGEVIKVTISEEDNSYPKGSKKMLYIQE